MEHYLRVPLGLGFSFAHEKTSYKEEHILEVLGYVSNKNQKCICESLLLFTIFLKEKISQVSTF
jgi:hypothetical protein